MGFCNLYDWGRVGIVGLLVLSTLAASQQADAAASIEGVAMDRRGAPLAGLTVELATIQTHSIPVFDDERYRTSTDEDGRFAMALDDRSVGIVSFHLIAYSEDHFGEAFNTRYRLIMGSTTHVHVLCGQRHTARVRATDSDDTVPSNVGPCLVQLRGQGTYRTHYIAESELGEVHEFPLGPGRVDVHYYRGRESPIESWEGEELPSEGWQLRGSVQDAVPAAAIDVPIAHFAGDSDKHVTLRVPLKNVGTSVIGVTGDGRVAWREYLGGYFLSHIGDMKVATDEAGVKSYVVHVVPGPDVMKLLLHDVHNGVRSEIALDDEIKGREVEVEFGSVPDLHHLRVRLPREADVWPGHRVIFSIEKDSYRSMRSVLADEGRLLRIPMPGEWERVHLKIHLQSTADIDDFGLEGIASCGETLDLEWQDTHKFKFVVQGPDGEALGPQTCYIEREESDGVWRVVGSFNGEAERETRKMMILQVDREYRLRIGAIAMPPLSIRPGTSELHVTAWGYDEERDGGSSDDG